MFPNWKTTLGAVLYIAMQIAKAFGVEMPVGLDASLAALSVGAIGLFAKDNNVTGGTVKQ
jgi:uncharacterized membrane protein